MYINLGDYDTARSYLNKLNEIEIYQSEYIILNAELIIKQERYAEACDILERSTNLDKYEIWFQLGNLYWDLGEYKKSLMPFLKVCIIKYVIHSLCT